MSISIEEAEDIINRMGQILSDERLTKIIDLVMAETIPSQTNLDNSNKEKR